MILFSEARKKEDIFNPTVMKKFDEIKPCGSITETEARDFWNQVFENAEAAYDETEAQIASEVYGRSEEEFSFDFEINDSDIQKLLEGFNTENWENLSEAEKEALIREFTEILGDKLDIENLPEVEFFEASHCDCGGFDPDRNVICINRENFDDTTEIIDTVVHEMWHAYQYQRAQNSETYMDILYAYNFDNYIFPYIDEDGYVNFIDYQDQLIEAEARAFASMFRMEDGENEWCNQRILCEGSYHASRP